MFSITHLMMCFVWSRIVARTCSGCLSGGVVLPAVSLLGLASSSAMGLSCWMIVGSFCQWFCGLSYVSSLGGGVHYMSRVCVCVLAYVLLHISLVLWSNSGQCHELVWWPTKRRRTRALQFPCFQTQRRLANGRRG